MKKIYYFYRKILWYKDQGYSEVASPLNGLSIFLSIFNFLILGYGLKFPGWAYPVALVASVFALYLIGLIVVKSGVAAYVQSLSNGQNPELLQILKKLEELKNDTQFIQRDNI